MPIRYNPKAKKKPVFSKHGYVRFKEPNGHVRSKTCDHDEQWILKYSRKMDALIDSAKPGYRGHRECMEPKKPKRTLEESKRLFFEALEKMRQKSAERKKVLTG
jgi:hypothetical protein